MLMTATARLIGALTAVATSMALPRAICLIANTGATVIGATVAATMAVGMACANRLDGADRRLALMTARRAALTGICEQLQIGGGQQGW